MYSIESRFVVGPSNILVACMYVCTSQPGNFTGWGGKGFDVCVACTSGYAFPGIVLGKCGILLDSGRCNWYDLEGVRAGLA